MTPLQASQWEVGGGSIDSPTTSGLDASEEWHIYRYVLVTFH